MRQKQRQFVLQITGHRKEKFIHIVRKEEVEEGSNLRNCVRRIE